VSIAREYFWDISECQLDFGASVTSASGNDGLVHSSPICEQRVQDISDKLPEGDVAKVEVPEVDRQGGIRLSMKAVGQDQPGQRGGAQKGPHGPCLWRPAAAVAQHFPCTNPGFAVVCSPLEGDWCRRCSDAWPRQRPAPSGPRQS